MDLSVGYQFTYRCERATPMLFVLNIHSERAADIVLADRMTTTPPQATSR